MNNSTEVNKEKLLGIVYQHFMQSTDCNGLPLSSVTSCDKDEIKTLLLDLIDNNKICILSQHFDSNPHIIRFGFPSKNEQLKYIKDNTLDEEIVLYPSVAYLTSNNHNFVNNELHPFKDLMFLGYPQLKACFFEYNVLQYYAFDPRMNFKFSDYQGEIHSSSDIDSRKFINLKTFGIGRNCDDIVIVAYPRDLQYMSTMNQCIWYNHMIHETQNCKVLKNYQDNTFNCSWSFPDTIYHAILKEIININELTSEAFKKTFFKKTFRKNELGKFDMLPFPTLDSYNQFLLLMEKIIISNIDIHFFRDIISISNEDGKIRGSLDCLKEWISKVNNDCCNEIIDPLKKLRKERQAPAHKIQLDIYSNDYLLKQHSLCTSIYASLNLLRRLIQTHPQLKTFCVSYPNTNYIEV